MILTFFLYSLLLCVPFLQPVSLLVFLFEKSKSRPRMAFDLPVILVIMTPLGIVLGIVLAYTLTGDTLTTVVACLQAFSAGTFLFVALEEIIPKEMALSER